MAIVGSNLTQGGTTAATSGTTASVSPSSNNLLLLSVCSRVAGGTPNQPTITGNGVTWVLVNSADTGGTNHKKLFVFRGMAVSPSSGTVVIDYAGQTQSGINWTVDQFSGTDTTGTNGSGAIVQSTTNVDTTGLSTTFTVTLAAFSNASNATFGAVEMDTYVATVSPGSGFTQLGTNNAEGSTNLGIFTEWTSANDTTVDITDGAASSFTGVAIEIKAPTTTSRSHLLASTGIGS